MGSDRSPLKFIGDRVRRRRGELKLTQEELAHAAGLTPPYVSQIERGVRDIGVTVLLRLSTALETTPAALLRDEHGAPTRDPFALAFEKLDKWPAAKRRAALQILKELDAL